MPDGMTLAGVYMCVCVWLSACMYVHTMNDQCIYMHVCIYVCPQSRSQFLSRYIHFRKHTYVCACLAQVCVRACMRMFGKQCLCVSFWGERGTVVVANHASQHVCTCIVVCVLYVLCVY